MPTGRTLLAMVAAHGFIYAIGGESDDSPLATVERFDARRNLWKKMRSMSIPRSAAAVAVLNGNIVVIGGATQCNSCETTTVEQFNGKTWTKVQYTDSKNISLLWNKFVFVFFFPIASAIKSGKRLPRCNYLPKFFNRGRRVRWK